MTVVEFEPSPSRIDWTASNVSTLAVDRRDVAAKSDVLDEWV